VVYVPHWADGHSDHRILFDACKGALKSFYMGLFGVRSVLTYEVLSETDAAAPNWER
jgi:hypothetical protein